ncbi:ATP synthase subunit I [Peptostreptococcus russellii]|uniref:ATP synthase I chain n=1 Tax=Peptostreptococcus russellii TaxID=215200 RepID=A0A1H8H3Y0_9FIRM|nr:ATP synthase subunit I [Peptostreptococcus russellii]MBC2577969.1 ATP synthase subunit I [Peptostreptococcus russellii]SEN50946.1 ATP synthase I chain [Peptostreptococcus russellii]
MDITVLNSIKKILIGMGIYDIVVLVILFVIRKASFSTIGGLLAGSIISVIALLMLTKNVVDLVDKDKGKASVGAVFGYLLRLSLYAAILIFAAVTEYISIYTVAVGLISTSLVIKAQNLVLKKNRRKEE